MCTKLGSVRRILLSWKMVPGGSSGGSAAATPQHILFGSDYPYVKTDSSLDELSRARLSAKDGNRMPKRGAAADPA